MQKKRICIIGSGQVGTACALRLFRAGFAVIILEQQHPVDIYQHITFSSAYFSGKRTIEGITARTLPGAIEAGMQADIEPDAFVHYQLSNREIALINTAQIQTLKNLKPDYFVVTKKNYFPLISDQLPEEGKYIVVGENLAGSMHYRIADDALFLGRVEYAFIEDRPANETRESVKEHQSEVVRAPLEGVFTTVRQVGEIIHEKEEIGKINDIPILAPLFGRIGGLLNSGLFITAKTIFAEIDKVTKRSAKILPVKAFAIAGGVLEAILYDLNL